MVIGQRFGLGQRSSSCLLDLLQRLRLIFFIINMDLRRLLLEGLVVLLPSLGELFLFRGIVIVQTFELGY